eukprot:scaffold913_cov73-Phaeocystis_antarctica.AAC.6
MALTASPILGLDDDVLRIFGEKVEEESGIVAVAALACSCHMFHALLQPRASALKVESLAALCTRLGEDDLDSRPLGVASHLRWRGRGLTDVDLALIASDWLRPKGRLQGLVALDMWKAEPGEGGDGTPNSFGVRGVRALAAALPHLDSLTSLTLERGGEVPSTLLKGTAPSTINLSSPGPLTACMVGLLAARNPKLKRLKLGDSGTQVLPVRELCGNAPSCQKLDFSSGLWHLGKLSGLAIGAMLSTNASLVYLDLSHNFSPGMQCTCSAHAVHTQCTRSAHAVHMQCTCSAHAVYMRPRRVSTIRTTSHQSRAAAPSGPAPWASRCAPPPRCARSSCASAPQHAQRTLAAAAPMRPTPPLRKPTRLLRAALAREGRLCCLGAGERLLCCLPSVTDSTALSHPIPPPLATQAHCVSRAASRSPPRCAPPRHALSAHAARPARQRAAHAGAPKLTYYISSASAQR